MDYLDFNGLLVYDEQIKSYINTVSDSGIKIIPMNAAPTSSTLTYTIEGITYNFNVGDEVIVHDTTEGTEETNYYVVYKLYSIENNTAYWDLAGQGGGSIDQLMETVNVTLNGGAFTSELSDVVVTATIDGTATEYTGTNIQFKVPFGIHYSVSAASVTGFDTPTGAVSDVTAVAGNTRNITFTYGYKTVDLTVGTNQSDMADLENTNISIDNKQFTLNLPTATSQSFSTHVATGTSVVFTFGSVTGYKAPVIADTTANDNIDLSVNYQTTIVTCNAVVDPAAGKSASDVSFEVNSNTLASGESVKIPTGDTITITSTDLTSYGYGCTLNPASGTVASGVSMTFTANYQTEVLTISSVTADEGDVTGAVFIVNGVAKTYGTDTLTWYIPFGESDIITHNISGYNVTITKTPNTDVADSATKTAVVSCKVIKNGVFAYYSDGTMLTYENATTSAIGVAVITNNCAFVIDKTATNGNNYIKYGGYNKDLSSTAVTSSSSATAKLDFDGENNTDRIINACAGYNDGYVTGAAAAEACRAAFNGKGYLGSLGEWQEAYNNKSDVNNMMTKIGGTAIKTDDYHWTSTHYDASGRSWCLSWSDGSTNGNYRYYYYVRAFRALSLYLFISFK